MNTKHERPLAGKVALVTGGSRGIGASIAIWIARPAAPTRRRPEPIAAV